METQHGGRLGVAVLDMATGRGFSHRGSERFLMCSTFKLLLVAAVLGRVDRGEETLARRVVFDADAILDWAPVTGLNVGAPGMTIGQLCEAAVIMSDNTAANLLLATLGGPEGWTAYVRHLGNSVSRLDHTEPLNDKQSGGEDTTTPLAMLADMRKVLLGGALSSRSRTRLTDWVVLNQTGAQSLRAGFPVGWRIGDKTGAATYANNDIAIVWPPHRAPLLVTVYYMTDAHDTAKRKKVLADVGRIVATI